MTNNIAQLRKEFETLNLLAHGARQRGDWTLANNVKHQIRDNRRQLRDAIRAAARQAGINTLEPPKGSY